MITPGSCYLCGVMVWGVCPHCNNLVPKAECRQGLLDVEIDEKSHTKVTVCLCGICEKTLTKIGMESIIKNLQSNGECLQLNPEKTVGYITWEKEFGVPWTGAGSKL